MHLVMFDIDGTLVDSDGFDGMLYAEAIRTVLEVDIGTDWSRYSNVTDTGILAEVLDGIGHPGDRAAIVERVRREFVRLTRSYLRERRESLHEIRGARTLVELLARKPGVALAIATGGWRETALLKLHAIGIDARRIALASASDAIERGAIMRLAETRALAGATALDKTYFGDGHWDKRACELLDYAFVAIGGGVPHHAAFDDLSDHGAILAHLGVD